MLGKTLYGKVAALLLGLFLFLGLFYLILTMVTTRAFIREVDQRLNVRLASYLVSKNSFIRKGKVNDRALKESFESLMKINPDIELYLLDRKGRILSFAAPPGRVKRESVSLAPIDRFLSGTGSLPITGDDPRNPGERKVFSAATFPEGGPAKGYLYVILGSEEHDTMVDMLGSSYILRLSTGILIAGLLFSLAAGLFLFYLLTRRLRELTREVEEFKESDFLGALPEETSVAFGKSDEIDRLSHVFRDMSQRIGSQLREIHQADSLRREMLGNISHDLRTPLAFLRGYIHTVHLQKTFTRTGHGGLESSPVQCRQRGQHRPLATEHRGILAKNQDLWHKITTGRSQRVFDEASPPEEAQEVSSVTAILPYRVPASSSLL